MDPDVIKTVVGNEI